MNSWPKAPINARPIMYTTISGYDVTNVMNLKISPLNKTPNEIIMEDLKLKMEHIYRKSIAFVEKQKNNITIIQ